MKDGMLVTELQNSLRKAENDIEDIIVKLMFEGVSVTNMKFMRHGKQLVSDPPGYGVFVPKIDLIITL